MDLPITRPFQISYGDEVNFNELIDKLQSEKFNGFIRITAGSSEGYILFKNGVQKASSYDNISKSEAIEKIKTIINDNRTIIELFFVRGSQIDYLMDLNKPFIIDRDSKINDLKEDLKIKKNGDSIVSENNEDSIIEEAPEIDSTDKSSVPLEEKEDKVDEIDNSPEIPQNEDIVAKDKLERNPPVEKPVIEEPEKSELGSLKPELETQNLSRKDIMKKYGLKEVGDTEINNLIENYRGGTISDKEAEKVELKLMNEIKKKILGIPKIKGTEVMVFLDNSEELNGNIDIIVEYEKGFLSRLRVSSQDHSNLKRQITNFTQMEIKKNFRGYPEMVDNFEINVEIN